MSDWQTLDELKIDSVSIRNFKSKENQQSNNRIKTDLKKEEKKKKNDIDELRQVVELFENLDKDQIDYGAQQSSYIKEIIVLLLKRMSRLYKEKIKKNEKWKFKKKYLIGFRECTKFIVGISKNLETTENKDLDDDKERNCVNMNRALQLSKVKDQQLVLVIASDLDEEEQKEYLKQKLKNLKETLEANNIEAQKICLFEPEALTRNKISKALGLRGRISAVLLTQIDDLSLQFVEAIRKYSDI
ncbi:MAG: hypothetical protein MHMPM18_000148 [Marteilia pararefringens]